MAKSEKTAAKGKGKSKTEGEKKTRKHGASFKDVQLKYLTMGEAGVAALFEAGKVKGSTIRRAYRKLVESTGDANAASGLASWIVANLGSLSRGRTSPQPGDLRTYKVQGFVQKTKLKDKDGNLTGEVKEADHESLFLRLDVSSIEGITKGQTLFVAFGDEEIFVCKNPPSDADPEDVEEAVEEVDEEEVDPSLLADANVENGVAASA